VLDSLVGRLGVDGGLDGAIAALQVLVNGLTVSWIPHCVNLGGDRVTVGARHGSAEMRRRYGGSG
jgi:hypothetical protein